MALPEAFLQELLLRSDISEIASTYVNLKRHGRNLVGLCPFHNEKTPSFNIYTESNSFYCFGCGAGGNVINFIMRIENLDYIDAVKLLAQRAGMNMPEESYDDSMSRLRKRIFEANRAAARFYHSCLYSNEGQQGLDYLHKRALTDKTIRRFGLGFAPDSPFALTNHLKSLGFTDYELETANLAVKSKKTGKVIDRFFNRVMFPIIDLRANVIAFGGRIMTDQKPKYLNTSDTPVFKKSANLFSLNNAKNTANRQLILCEGYMDVIAVNQAGFHNAVATLGTALTKEQAVLMKRYADEVVICYDADEAGQKATARAIEILRSTGIEIKVLRVPNGKDPDEFIRSKGENGPVAFKNILENCGNDLEYQLQNLKLRFDVTTPQGKVGYLNEAVKILARLENKMEQDVYISKLSGELSVEKSTIVTQVNKLSRQNYKARQKKEFTKLQSDLSGTKDTINKQHYQMPRATKAEESLLAYLINNPDSVDYINAKLPPEKFRTDFNRRLYVYFSGRIKSGLHPTSNMAADFTMEESGKITAIMTSCSSLAATRQALDEYINVILQESERLSDEKISTATDDELMDFIKRIKQQKK